MTRFLMLLTVLVASTASAGASQYECTVHDYFGISSDGVAERGGYIVIGEEPLGKVFYVERSNGTMMGGGFANTSFATRRVLDPGEPGQAYVVLSMSYTVVGTEAGHNTMYLEIKEFDENAMKPFVLVEVGGIVTGLCN